MPVRRLNSSSASISSRARRPAERIGRRREQDGARARVAGGEQLVEVEPPVAVEIERDGARLAAGEMDRVVDVRPLRLDVDDVRAGIDEELERHEDRLHAARRHGRALDRNCRPCSRVR